MNFSRISNLLAIPRHVELTFNSCDLNYSEFPETGNSEDSNAKLCGLPFESCLLNQPVSKSHHLTTSLPKVPSSIINSTPSLLPSNKSNQHCSSTPIISKSNPVTSKFNKVNSGKWLNFITLNCQSLRKKTHELKAILLDQKIDVVILQETWLYEGDSSVYTEFEEMGYKTIKLERVSKKGGGLAIFIRNDKHTKLKVFYNFKYQSFENLFCSANFGKNNILIANIYRPPSLSKSNFVMEFEDFLGKLLEQNGTVFIFGDLNINLLTKDNIIDKFLNILSLNGISQLTKTPTRGNAILDYILAPTCQLPSLKTFSPNSDFSSDHKPLFLRYKQNKDHIVFKPITKKFRDYSCIDYNDFRNKIINSDLCNLNKIETLTANECVEMYNTTISKIFNQICPLKTKTFKKPQSLKWFNSSVQTLKQNKRKAERKMKKSPNNMKYKELYKKAKNKYTSGIKQARINFFADKIQRKQKDPKQLHKILKGVTGNQKERILPSIDSKEDTAEKMADFYIQKVEKIQQKIQKHKNSYKNTNLKYKNSTNVQPLNFFKQINMDTLKDIIRDIKKKPCSLDPIPIFVLQHVLDLLHPLFLRIINSTISEASFPDILKFASVTPIIKDPKLDPNNFQHFRPVSSLPFVSKLVEKAIYLQLDEHLKTNKLYPIFQSAYRTNHSCETTLTKLTNDIQNYNFKGRDVALILLDQSAAFDTVNHAKLIRKLQIMFKIQGKCLQLIESYLTNRTFSIKIDDYFSSARPLLYGVPQGSLLGPLFYILYTADMEPIFAKYNLNFHCYADDTQILLNFSNEDMNEMEIKLSNCLEDIKVYMGENSLMLNENKTIVKVFWAKKPNVSINKILTYNITSSVRILGATIGENFKLNDFISKKVQISNMHLRNLYNVRACLNYDTRKLLITNLILSTLDYCNILLINCNKKELRPLKLIMNRCIRFVYNIKFRQHVSPFYKKIHFLPIRKRIQFKACLLAHKIFYRSAPEYLNQEFHPYVPQLEMQLRRQTGRDPLMFDTSGDHIKGKQIYFQIRREWNALPLQIRELEQVGQFKKKLKTELFSQL